jgi:hypothetical protein
MKVHASSIEHVGLNMILTPYEFLKSILIETQVETPLAMKEDLVLYKQE